MLKTERHLDSLTAGFSLDILKQNYCIFVKKIMEVEIQNRFNIGPSIGWGFYPIDEEYDDNELIIYLTFISIHFRWV